MGNMSFVLRDVIDEIDMPFTYYSEYIEGLSNSFS
jgi:hypothetical protein